MCNESQEFYQSQIEDKEQWEFLLEINGGKTQKVITDCSVYVEVAKDVLKLFEYEKSVNGYNEVKIWNENLRCSGCGPYIYLFDELHYFPKNYKRINYGT